VGQDIDLAFGVQWQQFPLSLWLPSQVQILASLSRQQNKLAREQASLIESQPQMLDKLNRQVEQHVQDMRNQMQELFVTEVQKLMTSMTLRFEENRTIRDENQKQMLEQVQTITEMCTKQGTAGVAERAEIRGVCEKSRVVLQDITGALKESERVGKHQYSELLQKEQNTSSSLKTLSAEMENLPDLLKGVGENAARLQNLAKSLEVLPAICNDTRSKCGDVQGIAQQLKSLPSLLQATHGTCEDILRMSGESKSVLGVLEDTRRTCSHIRDGVSDLEACHDAHQKLTENTCEAIERLASGLAALPNALHDTQSTCEHIHKCVTDALPVELKTLQQQSSDNKREGLWQHQTVIDRIASVETMVSKSQPLTLDQYMALTNTIQQVLTEMRNPIPQPKMSFANAVVHVHKGKKCDDLALSSKFTSAGGKPTALSLRDHLDEMDIVELPLSNLTGRLRKDQTHQGPVIRPPDTPSRRAESARGESREKKYRGIQAEPYP